MLVRFGRLRDPRGNVFQSNSDQAAGGADRSPAEWRARLTPAEYRVTREGGTEPAFRGRYWNEKRPGTYSCLCCGRDLFDSNAKYDSGSGWPSFSRPVEEDCVRELPDGTGAMGRTELRCAACDAHLGHVFEDGPAPAGRRYCINSLALRLRLR